MDSMKMMDVFGKLEEKALKDLETLADKGDINPTEWQRVKEVVCILKDMCECKEGMEDGYSSDRMPGYSSRRGRSMTTGRYISRDYDPSYMGPDYNARGYSGHSIKDRMIANLEKMMDEASSEYERETIRAEIRKLEMEK